MRFYDKNYDQQDVERAMETLKQNENFFNFIDPFFISSFENNLKKIRYKKHEKIMGLSLRASPEYRESIEHYCSGLKEALGPIKHFDKDGAVFTLKDLNNNLDNKKLVKFIIQNSNHPIFQMWESNKVQKILRDLSLFENILIKDFNLIINRISKKFDGFKEEISTFSKVFLNENFEKKKARWITNSMDFNELLNLNNSMQKLYKDNFECAVYGYLCFLKYFPLGGINKEEVFKQLQEDSRYSFQLSYLNDFRKLYSSKEIGEKEEKRKNKILKIQKYLKGGSSGDLSKLIRGFIQDKFPNKYVELVYFPDGSGDHQLIAIDRNRGSNINDIETWDCILLDVWGNRILHSSKFKEIQQNSANIQHGKVTYKDMELKYTPIESHYLQGNPCIDENSIHKIEPFQEEIDVSSLSYIEYEGKKEIPRLVHFIWVGGNIKEEYLKSIIFLSSICKNYKIIIWTDNEQNIKNTFTNLLNLDLVDIPKLTFEIKNINELIVEMKEHPFFKKDKLYRTLTAMINREMVGLKNLAAASDILRYIALFLKGGTYLDTDLKFKKESEIPETRSAIGFFGNFRINFSIPKHKKVINQDNLLIIAEESMVVNNDVLAFCPYHRIVQNIILKLKENYKQLDSTPLKNVETLNLNNMVYKPSSLYTKNKYDLKCMDAKRYNLEYETNRSKTTAGRLQLTIDASGPSLIYNEVARFLFSDATSKEVKTTIYHHKISYEKANNKSHDKSKSHPITAVLPGVVIDTQDDNACSWFSNVDKEKISYTTEDLNQKDNDFYTMRKI